MRSHKGLGAFGGFAKSFTANWAGAGAPSLVSQLGCAVLCVQGNEGQNTFIGPHCFINIVAIKFLHRQDTALCFRLLNFLILELVGYFIA